MLCTYILQHNSTHSLRNSSKMPRSCGHGNISLGSIKGGQFFGYPSDYNALKKGSFS